MNDSASLRAILCSVVVAVALAALAAGCGTAPPRERDSRPDAVTLKSSPPNRDEAIRQLAEACRALPKPERFRDQYYEVLAGPTYVISYRTDRSNAEVMGFFRATLRALDERTFVSTLDENIAVRVYVDDGRNADFRLACSFRPSAE